MCSARSAAAVCPACALASGRTAVATWPCPPSPACLEAGGSGSARGSQIWAGTDCPAQWKPHSCTHRRSSASDVTVGSYTTVALCATGLTSTCSTPGRRPSTAETTFCSEAQLSPRTSSTAVAEDLPVCGTVGSVVTDISPSTVPDGSRWCPRLGPAWGPADRPVRATSAIEASTIASPTTVVRVMPSSRITTPRTAPATGTSGVHAVTAVSEAQDSSANHSTYGTAGARPPAPAGVSRNPAGAGHNGWRALGGVVLASATPPSRNCQAPQQEQRVSGAVLQAHQVDHVDHRYLQLGQMLARQVRGGVAVPVASMWWRVISRGPGRRQIRGPRSGGTTIGRETASAAASWAIAC